MQILLLLSVIHCNKFSVTDDEQMSEFINFLRINSGMEPLEEHPALVAVAKEHVRSMCRGGKLTHASRNLTSLIRRIGRKGLHIERAAENIAKQYSYTKSNMQEYTEVAKKWFRSTEHRRIMLGPFNYTGVASCDTGNEKYWVQVFAKEEEMRQPDKTVRDSGDLSYGIIDPARSPCTLITECDVGEMVRPSTFSQIDQGIRTKTVTV
ncbi:hypothetical protein ECANGB1_621, partial [Enterospora canceri]